MTGKKPAIFTISGLCVTGLKSQAFESSQLLVNECRQLSFGHGANFGC